MAKAKSMSNQQVYQMITDKVVESLKAGRIAWQRPWVGGTMPQNYISKNPYRGINLWITFFAPYESPYWVSFKQAKKLGGNVKQGEKGTKITFWKPIVKKLWNDDGTPKLNKLGKQMVDTFLVLKHHTIFNAEQCEGIDFEVPAKTAEGAEDVASADSLIDLYADIPVVKHSAMPRAYYAPRADEVHMPNKDTFKSTEDYYSVKFHELAHSTGAKHRLNRDGVANFDRFGSHQYSIEELVAEMSACFMMANAGLAIEPRDNSKAYIQNWISKLENNPKFIFDASREAQKACNYMMGIEEKKYGEDENKEQSKGELKQAA